MGFRHSGHCSAPRTMEPPLVGVWVGVPVDPAGGLDELDPPPPQATATMPAAATRATVRSKTRSRTAPPFPRNGAGADTWVDRPAVRASHLLVREPEGPAPGVGPRSVP